MEKEEEKMEKEEGRWRRRSRRRRWKILLPPRGRLSFTAPARAASEQRRPRVSPRAERSRRRQNALTNCCIQHRSLPPPCFLCVTYGPHPLNHPSQSPHRGAHARQRSL